MKTTIKIENNIVVLCHDAQDWDMETTRVRREFMVPAGGGYIREWNDHRKEWVQVCDGLANRGNTLHTHNGSMANLLAIIRHEWQSARRLAKRESIANW
ncbi:MAG: hypothetical protein WAT23_12655 [Chromatiaceae bacterium]